MKSKLFNDMDSDKEYKFKFLVYPNITKQGEIEKDSYIQVIRNVILVLNDIRNDIHFTLITPKEVDSFNLPNVEQVIYEMPAYPNSMRLHFDFNKLMEIVDYRRNDYDVLYSHLPEHTAQLANLFTNSTNLAPIIIGYCHWYEIDENTNYDKNMFLANIAGTLEMKECGVNTEWVKNLSLKHSAEYFNQDILSKLEKIIQPHYLGVDNINFDRVAVEKNSIVFNHRDDDYTGRKWMLNTLDSLYDEGIKFHLYTTQWDAKKPYSNQSIF